MYVSCSPQRKGRNSKEVFEEIMAENFPNWIETINPQIQKYKELQDKKHRILRQGTQ